MQPEIPLGNLTPHDSSKSVAGMPKEGTGEAAILEKTCHQNQLKLRMDTIDLTTDVEIPLEDDMSTRDLNVEPSRWLFNQKEPMLPGPSSLGHRTLSAGTSLLSPRNDDMHKETCRTLEKVSKDII